MRDTLSFDFREAVDSTNDLLLRLAPGEIHARVVLAERQTAGKGRRGRRWQSPAGNICLSIGWHFEAAASSLGALGLVAGVCVCRALARLGLRGHGVKWPNDVQIAGAKLGGILVELRGGREGCDAVIGIGFNVNLGAHAALVDQPVTDLVAQTGLETRDRCAIIAAVLNELVSALDEAEAGLAAFLEPAWPEWDLLQGRDVRITREGGEWEGRAEGIAADGALSVRLHEGTRALMSFHSGEVSVRRA